MKSNIGSRYIKILFYIGSFGIPLIIILLSLFRSDIFPFGDRTLVYHDMIWQYTDFFMWFRQVLEGKDSLFYSFNLGMGGNTIGLVAYYLASPLNILVFLSDTVHMAEFLTIFIIVKLALCGLTSFVYLNKRYEVKGMWGLLISTAYALMGYNILQCSNIMWLDGVMILPILALGVYYSVYLKKYKVYFFSLLYAVVSNWYIGYMLCIFVVLLYFLETLLLHEKKKFNFRRAGKDLAAFAIRSLLALMTSCFIFLPQTLWMMKESGETDWSVLQPAFGFSYLEGFRDLFLQGDKLTQIDWIPPIYIGSFVLMLTVLFFIDKTISKYKKIVFGVLLFGFMFMMCFKPLNYMFTGFKYPASHFYRQAFLFSFIMISIAGLYLKESANIMKDSYILKAALGLVFAALAYDLVKNYEPRTQVYVSCFLILIVGVVLYVRSKVTNIYGCVALSLVLLCCTVLEFSNKMVLEFEDHLHLASEYSEYNLQMMNEIEELKEQDQEIDNYRIDKEYFRNGSTGFGNECLAFLYSSISQYTSTGDTQLENVLRDRYGYGSDSKSLLYSSNLPVDSLLGVKYIFSGKNVYGAEVLQSDLIWNSTLYTNSYALPLAFGVKDDLASFIWDDNIFEGIACLYETLTGETASIYSYPEITCSGTDNTSWTSWKLSINQSGPLYLYLKNGNEGTTIEVNGQVIDTNSYYSNHIMFAGEYETGDTVEVKVYNGTFMEDYGFQAASLNMSVFGEMIGNLKNDAGEVVYKKDGKVELKYDCADKNTLLITLPYDEGWKVSVNGKAGEIYQAADSLMAVDVEQGENTIVLEYKVQGLKSGIAISIIGITLFLVSELANRRKKFVSQKIQ